MFEEANRGLTPRSCASPDTDKSLPEQQDEDWYGFRVEVRALLLDL